MKAHQLDVGLKLLNIEAIVVLSHKGTRDRDEFLEHAENQNISTCLRKSPTSEYDVYSGICE